MFEAPDPACSDRRGESGEWVVVVEHAAAERPSDVDAAAVEELVSRLGAWDATGICCPDRYAVVLRVCARTASEALQAAVEAHHAAVGAAGRPTSSLVRAEVHAADQFEASQADDSEGAGPLYAGRYPGLTREELYLATRGLLWASTADEVTAVLVRFVTAVGGAVKVCPGRRLPGLMSIDLSFRDGRPLWLVAEMNGAAAAVIGESLPTLLDDACRVLKARRPRC